jgi:putative ABC transport system substrate-binding protein
MALKHKMVGVAALILMLPMLSHAKVLMVVSSDDSYYQEIAGSFKKSFDKPVDEFNLRGLEDEARKLGKSLSADKPELLIVVGNLSAKMAKESCPDCTTLYAAASNAGSLKLAGANVYGISSQPSPAKIIDNIKLVFPDAQKIGIIYQPSFVGKDIAGLQAAAAKAGVKIFAEPISQMKEIPTALNKLTPQIDLYLMLDDPGVITDDTFPYIFMNCFQKKIPIFATSSDILKKCAIAGYGYSPDQVGIELAAFAKDILSAKAGTVREKTASAKLYLNKKIAQMYNFNFPPQAANSGLAIQ